MTECSSLCDFVLFSVCSENYELLHVITWKCLGVNDAVIKNKKNELFAYFVNCFPESQENITVQHIFTVTTFPESFCDLKLVFNAVNLSHFGYFKEKITDFCFL